MSWWKTDASEEAQQRLRTSDPHASYSAPGMRLRAAGIDPASVRRRRRAWTAQEVVKEIRRKSRAGEPLNAMDVRPPGIRGAASRLFGSWNAALRAAGLDPARIRRNRWKVTPDNLATSPPQHDQPPCVYPHPRTS